jgi:hypothetical protein
MKTGRRGFRCAASPAAFVSAARNAVFLLLTCFWRKVQLYSLFIRHTDHVPPSPDKLNRTNGLWKTQIKHLYHCGDEVKLFP